MARMEGRTEGERKTDGGGGGGVSCLFRQI